MKRIYKILIFINIIVIIIPLIPIGWNQITISNPHFCENLIPIEGVFTICDDFYADNYIIYISFIAMLIISLIIFLLIPINQIEKKYENDK